MALLFFSNLYDSMLETSGMVMQSSKSQQEQEAFSLSLADIWVGFHWHKGEADQKFGQSSW